VTLQFNGVAVSRRRDDERTHAGVTEVEEHFIFLLMSCSVCLRSSSRSSSVAFLIMLISLGVKLPAARCSGESVSTNSKRWLPSFTLEARLCILFRYRAKELAVSPPKFFVLVNTTH
jgi:hypothetical protein